MQCNVGSACMHGGGCQSWGDPRDGIENYPHPKCLRLPGDTDVRHMDPADRVNDGCDDISSVSGPSASFSMMSKATRG